MDIGLSTLQLLTSLDLLSGRRLTRRDDLAALIELATRSSKLSAFEELSFHAKFVSKSSRIMKRIGKDADGYEKLLHECTAGLDHSKELLRTLLAEAPHEIQDHFASTYFALTTEGFQNFQALLYDLSWYKNWLIDAARKHHHK
jgi:hypothetical protein